MARMKLADRRRNETVVVDHFGHRFTITIGFDGSLRPMEVFADGTKIGTDLAHVIADACVVVSLALQHGCEASALVKSLGRVPWPAEGEDAERPASVLGAIADVVLRADRRLRLIPAEGGQ